MIYLTTYIFNIMHEAETEMGQKQSCHRDSELATLVSLPVYDIVAKSATPNQNSTTIIISYHAMLK